MITDNRMFVYSFKESLRREAVIIISVIGYDPAKVSGDINVHVRNCEASQAAAMISRLKN